MKSIFTHTLVAVLLVFSPLLRAQNTKNVLFLGNSYTFGNNLPQLVANMAASTGKTVNHDMHAPGGYYIAQHLTNQTSLGKIAEGNWDYVVLQDQSLALAYPSTYLYGMQYSVRMDSVIKSHNTCARTLFYSTWGRKNGDQYVCTPPECVEQTLIVRTYFEMDSTIESHYKVYADSVKGEMAPVGAVWRSLRQQFPSIELFQADDSHATLAGSYAAACCFYTAIFRSDPTLITFNSGLSATDAANIRATVKQVVYDHLTDWNVGVYDDLLDPACLTLNVEEPSGQWQVHPNPATDRLVIGDAIEQLQVVAPNGQELDVPVHIVSGSTELDLRKLAAGTYLLTVVRNGKVVHTRFVKQ